MHKRLVEYEITNRDKVFFLHIPKTAGISLLYVLRCWLGRTELHPIFGEEFFQELQLNTLSQYQFLSGHIPYTVNGWLIPLSKELHDDSKTLITGQIPKYAILKDRAFSRLQISVNRTVAPCDIDPQNADQRRLGVLVNWVEITP